MAGHQDIWRTEPDGSVAAEVDGLRLVVLAPERRGALVRFHILRRQGGEDGPHALVHSGTEPDARTAMKRAARIAGGLIGQANAPAS